MAASPRPIAKPVIAVLGLGSIGMRHAANFLELGVSVIGYDPNEPRRQALVAAGGAARQSRDAVLADADAVVIASPSQHHLADLEAAERFGLDVFAEKPIAHTDAGLPDLLNRLEAKGRIVYQGYMLRQHPAVVRTTELLAAGELGRPIWGRFVCSSWLPDWRPHQDYRHGYAALREGGALLDHIHEFDLAYRLLGPAEVSTASCHQSGLLEILSEDLADVLLRHENGCRSHIHVDYLTKPRQRRFEIGCENGLIAVDLNDRRLLASAGDGGVIEDRTFAGGYGDDYKAEAREFLTCMASRQRPACTPDDALAVLRLVLAARRADVGLSRP